MNLLFILVLILWSSSPCLSKEFKKTDFVKNINKYSEVHKACIIMEYFPCDEYFSSTENDNLKKINEENVDEFLMCFGYSVLVNKKENIIVGLKSYEKVQDTPDISFEEIKNCFSKMKNAFSDMYTGNSTAQTRESKTTAKIENRFIFKVPLRGECFESNICLVF